MGPSMKLFFLERFRLAPFHSFKNLNYDTAHSWLLAGTCNEQNPFNRNTLIILVQSNGIEGLFFIVDDRSENSKVEQLVLSKGTWTCSHVATKTAKKRMFSHRIRNSEYAIINFPRKLSKHRNTLTDCMKEIQDKFTGARVPV